MSTVLEFRSPISRACPREDGPTVGQIIIFPGVRRERHAQAHAEAEAFADAETALDACDAKPKRQGRARPKRDRIELPD